MERDIPYSADPANGYHPLPMSLVPLSADVYRGMEFYDRFEFERALREQAWRHSFGYRDDGLVAADKTKLSLAHLPYEIQVMIFDAASSFQIIFVLMEDRKMSVTQPLQAGLSSSCRMGRRIYLRNKVPLMNRYWVNPENDMFYLRDLTTPGRDVHRELSYMLSCYDRSMMQNIAIDFGCLGEYPRRDVLVRMWTIFPRMTQVHVFIMKDSTVEKPEWTPEGIVLSELPGLYILSPPGQDRELWWAVKYQLKKTCARILEAESGWEGRATPEVFGHFVHMRSLTEA